MASGRTRRVCRRPQSSSFVHELRVDSFVGLEALALLPVAVSFSVNSCIVKSFGAVASPGLWSTRAESAPSFAQALAALPHSLQPNTERESASVLHFQSRLRVELVCDALHRGMCKQFGLLSRTPKRATRRSPPRAPAPQIQISNLGSAGAARVIRAGQPQRHSEHGRRQRGRETGSVQSSLNLQCLQGAGQPAKRTDSGCDGASLRRASTKLEDAASTPAIAITER